MTGSSYGERDYAFGQLMLTLRTTIGLTQASLGDLLGVSQRAVAEWEASSSYPKVERLKQLIVLGVLQQVFPLGVRLRRSGLSGSWQELACRLAESGDSAPPHLGIVHLSPG